MNKIIIKEEINIEDMIYEIRGKQVMLDSDLAKLYQVETKRINEAVKRNLEKFPERFCFKINFEELDFLRSQFATLNKYDNNRGHNVKYMPYVFTEQGVAMLATILKSPIATQVSIRIMDAFVTMKKYISYNLREQQLINNMVVEDHEVIKTINEKINLLQESFNKFDEKKIVNEIYFNGQIYDAYSKIIDILKTAKKEIIIIDGYTDKSILDIIKNIDAKVILITKKKTKLTNTDIEKYNKQYHNLKIIYNETYHDWYFILDKSIIYHCGASINHAGSKTFSINILEDRIVKHSLINQINDIILKDKL